MKKSFFLIPYLLAIGSFCACGNDEEQGPIDTAASDGHYSVVFTVAKNTCSNDSVASTYQKFDFLAYDGENGKGMLITGNQSAWDELEIILDSEGNFKESIPLEPISSSIDYYGYGYEISGKLAGNKIDGEVIETYYSGETEDAIRAICYFQYTFSGYKRYKQKTAPAKNIEGEYKSYLAKKSSNCPGQSMLQTFPTFIIPQGKGYYHAKIDLQRIYNLPVAKDGKVASTIKTSAADYTLKGTVEPENFALDFSIGWNDDSKCVENYSIRGDKRFEENDGADDTIDGVYSALITTLINSCGTQMINDRYHLDAIKISNSKARLIVGNKDFTIYICAKNNFKGVYFINDDYKTTNSFEGKITPKDISGTLTIALDAAKSKCSFVYKVIGKKLYRHN